MTFIPLTLPEVVKMVVQNPDPGRDILLEAMDSTEEMLEGIYC